LPSYLCKEIVTPFQEEHVRLKFYKVDKTLNVDIDDVEDKIRRSAGQVPNLLANLGSHTDLPIGQIWCEEYGFIADTLNEIEARL